ncbi:GHMP family kinase ATP-binding protein [Actinosynnema sp.]|uniref:GHMP family kinase ATP-binding protein n=1 Tax=Actinosynnema sp. TaxID=1872144 RepID=UPI003F86CE80
MSRTPARPASEPRRPVLDSSRPDVRARGTGHAPSHHGELLQGCFADRAGARRNGLITLRLDEPRTRAEFRPDPALRPGEVRVVPEDRVNTALAAETAVRVCARLTGRAVVGGRVLLSGGVPVGLGMGSSTSDLIAAVRAVADAYRISLGPQEVAGIAVGVESASDPLMLDARPVLFAQREGAVIEVLGERLPPLVVLGCLTGGGAAVDTAALPVDDYSDDEVAEFASLREEVRRAVRLGDPVLLGRVCTRSALLNQRRLPKAELPDLLGAAEEAGAVGVQVAHSGNVAGVLFRADRAGSRTRAAECARLLARDGIPVTGVFDAPGS